MVNDTVRDPITGEEFVVIWNGGSLLDYDPRWTQQRSDSQARMTRDAVGAIGLRPDQVKCDVPVDNPW